MRKNLTFVFIILFYGCFSQTGNNLIKTNKKIQSLKAIRESSNIILNKFRDSATEKILIYIEDKGFKIIINNNKFNKYDIIGNQIKLIKSQKNIECNKKEFKILKKAFDFELYETKTINKNHNFKYSQGNLMYFVAIDNKQKTFGEFYLPCYTFPTVIDQDILLYILKLYGGDSCPAHHVKL